MPCAPASVREDFELHFDPAFKLLRPPANLKVIGEDGIRYEAEYRLENQVLSGWRELTLSQARHWCSPVEYARRRPVMTQIRQNLRAAILYQQ